MMDTSQYENYVEEKVEEPILARPSIIGGMIGGVIGGVIGMFGWYFLIKVTGFEIGIAAWGVGVLVGVGTLVGSRESCDLLGYIAGAFAALAIIGGQCLAVNASVDQYLGELAAQAYEAELEFAHKVCNAEDEKAIRRCIAEINAEGDEQPDPKSVTKEQVEGFDEEIRPRYEQLLAGEPSQEEFVEKCKSAIKSEISFGDLLKESLSLWTGLWLLLGVGSAYKIGAGIVED